MLLQSHGGLCVQGTAEKGCGATFRGKNADIHKTLISASKVHSKGHVAIVNSNGGYIIPYNSTFARHVQQFVQHEIIN